MRRKTSLSETFPNALNYQETELLYGGGQTCGESMYFYQINLGETKFL